MNRRQLLKLLPVAPLAAISVPVAAAEPAVTDTRPSFALHDYVMWVNDGAQACRSCGSVHEVYTHGCQPIAFGPHNLPLDVTVVSPASSDAVPYRVYQDCPFRPNDIEASPHRHHDFRWEDA